ncbi:MAG TPA: saccharopine dehydrogenase C-terminal domain-containing protein, partial [bacterium]|nr:saccharopine dehydrogenase C-terminal domain-containing protein [bacterium]
MAKEILVLGAGMVARPLVDYVLGRTDYGLKIASRTVSKAEALVAGRERGACRPLNVDDDEALAADVRAADLVISLVPYTYHVRVAECCLAYGKPLITTSYVNEGMRALDGRARDAGLLFLNEIGLDPGIDHMSAMRVIHGARKGGGRVTSFKSYCGGLPAPEANANPWGYKFSWSPRAVILASRNAARYLEDGRVVEVPGEELFADCRVVDVPGAGEFERYPNRDSLPYVETYGLEGAATMFRGTLRNAGWCATWLTLSRLGFLDDAPQKLGGLSYAEFTARVLGSSGEDVRKEFAARAGVGEDADVVARLAWLGFFSDEPVPCDEAAPMDVLAVRLQEKCPYEEGERDMIVLHHEFDVDYGGRGEFVTSTLVDFGVPGGDSAMARTVSLPAAIAARLMLEGEIELTGV